MIKTGIVTNPSRRRRPAKKKAAPKRAAPKRAASKRAASKRRAAPKRRATTRRRKPVGSYTLTVKKNPQGMIGDYTPIELGTIALATAGGVVGATVLSRMLNDKIENRTTRGAVKSGLGLLTIVGTAMAAKQTGGKSANSEKRTIEALGISASGVLLWSGVADLLGWGDGSEAVPSSVTKTSAMTVDPGDIGDDDDDMEGYYADDDGYDDDMDGWDSDMDGWDSDMDGMYADDDDEYDDFEEEVDEDMNGLREDMQGLIPPSQRLAMAMGQLQPSRNNLLPKNNNVLQ